MICVEYNKKFTIYWKKQLFVQSAQDAWMALESWMSIKFENKKTFARNKIGKITIFTNSTENWFIAIIGVFKCANFSLD